MDTCSVTKQQGNFALRPPGRACSMLHSHQQATHVHEHTSRKTQMCPVRCIQCFHCNASKRLSSRCSAQQHQQGPQQQYSSTPHQPSHAHSFIRRSLLGSAAVASLATALLPHAASFIVPKPSEAYIVEEVVAQTVFAIASRSVVSINDYRRQNGAEIFEGVGTGIVWDQYGHSK